MIRIISINSMQPPFEIDPIGDGRSVFSCNFMGLVCLLESADLYLELVTFVASQMELPAIGINPSNIFIGKSATPPDVVSEAEDGPFARIILTGGAPVDYPQGLQGHIQHRISFQVLSLSYSNQTAMQSADKIYRFLSRVRNVDL